MTVTDAKITTTSSKGTVSILIGIFMLMIGCKTKDNTPGPTQINYDQVNLVADTASLGAARVDVNLKNAWGISISPTGIFWISSNHSGSTVVYDTTGKQLLASVAIPLGADPRGGSPTGVIFNSSGDFIIPGKGKSLFIFSTENGILSAWNGSTGVTTLTVADQSSTGAVYKGLALANDGGSNFIYAADFHNARVDVFDRDFAFVTSKPFSDPGIPPGYAPFNVQNINDQLYVTYAKQLGPDNADDQAGMGNGYVDIYSPAGVLIRRFASQGTLNSPWGIVQAPATFGQAANSILIGNFGDGHINVYDTNGAYQGQLMTKGTAIAIPGLWAITFNAASSADPNKLYFAAGPDGETHGLFGYLKIR